MRPLASVLVLAVAFALPSASGFAPMTADYVGGDVPQTTVSGPGIGTTNVGGATFIHMPAGTTQVAVSVLDDNWGTVDFVVCQDVDGNAACEPGGPDVYKEACGPVTVTGIDDDLSVRVFVVSSWKSVGIGKCEPGGFVGVTTGTITLTPS